MFHCERAADRPPSDRKENRRQFVRCEVVVIIGLLRPCQLILLFDLALTVVRVSFIFASRKRDAHPLLCDHHRAAIKLSVQFTAIAWAAALPASFWLGRGYCS